MTELLTLDQYRKEEALQENVEDHRHVTLGGILSRSGNTGYCFKVEGDSETLRLIKPLIQHVLQEHGFQVKIEHRYHD